MKRPVLVLIIRRHAGELDWILPLLYKFKKSYEIITIFSDKNSHRSIQENKDLFNAWKIISNKYFIVSKDKDFFWKILHHVIIKLSLNKFNFFLELERFILSKTFNINYFLKKFSVTIDQIKSIFVTTTHLSNLPNIFKNKNPKILLVRYPESTMIAATKNENFRIMRPYTYRNVKGDLFLFSSSGNKDFFLGNQNLKIQNNKIYYCRMLRYENWWIKNFIRSKKNKDKMFRILVAIRNPNEDFFQRSSYDEIVNAIMKIAEKYKNCKVIFKTHPQDTNIILLKLLLSKFKKNLWEISSEHLMTLSFKSNFCISIITSACFDSLAMKIPTVEFYIINKEIKKSNKVKSCMHMVFDKNKKKWLTIFNYKKVVNTVYDYKSLESYFLLAYSKKGKKMWNKNFFMFKRLSRLGHDTNSLYSFIKKKINTVNLDN